MKTSEDILKKRWMLLFSISAYLMLVYPFLNQLPMHEEVIHIRDTSSWGAALGYYCHPPLYVLIGRLSRSVFGETYISLYLAGMASAVVSLFLVWKILALFSSTRGRSGFIAIGVLLTATMPAFVHGSLLLEMEPVVLTPLCLAAIWFYLRRGGGERRAQFYIAAGLLFGLAMWAKYFITPFLLIGAVFIYEIGNCGLRGALKSSALIFMSAVSFFIPTYLLYSHFFIKGINSFSFLMVNKTAEGIPLFVPGWIGFTALTKLMALWFWLSPYFIALLIYLCLGLLIKWRRYKEERFLFSAVIIIFFFYLFMHPYPFSELKYFYPMFPLLALLASTLLASEKIMPLPLPYLIFIPFFAVVFYLTLGDPMYLILNSYRELSFDAIYKYLALYGAVSAGAFLIVYLTLLRSLKDKRSALSYALLSLTLASAFSLFASQAAGRYQTRVQYGEKGAKELIEFVKNGIPASESVLMPGDIHYYAGIGFREKGTISEWDGGQWDWIIDRKINIRKLEGYKQDILRERFDLLEEFGSYLVYRRKVG